MIRRYAFILAFGISLLLCLATVALWVRGFWRFDTLVGVNGHAGFATGSRRGIVWISWGQVDDPDSARPIYRSGRPDELEAAVWNFYRTTAKWDVLGVYFVTSQNRDSKLLAAPTLFPAVCFAIPPLAAVAAGLRRRRRKLLNTCPTCGYNLTGNTSGVCPECGTPVPQKSGARA